MNILQLQGGIIYGPVNSRRLGQSLGLNIMPTDFKLCSLNCAYCQYGWTRMQTNSGEDHKDVLPSLPEIISATRQAFNVYKNFDYFTFSGNGESTLHPDFPEIVQAVRQIRDQMAPSVKIAILSNSTTCGQPEIKNALSHIDLLIMKLDAGNERTFKKLNHGLPPVSLASIVEGLKPLKKIVIQSMFVKGKIDNSKDKEVDSWIDKLKELNPLYVQIYSVDRGTANNRLIKVESVRLQQIAELAQKKTGLQVEVF